MHLTTGKYWRQVLIADYWATLLLCCKLDEQQFNIWRHSISMSFRTWIVFLGLHPADPLHPNLSIHLSNGIGAAWAIHCKPPGRSTSVTVTSPTIGLKYWSSMKPLAKLHSKAEKRLLLETAYLIPFPPLSFSGQTWSKINYRSSSWPSTRSFTDIEVSNL